MYEHIRRRRPKPWNTANKVGRSLWSTLFHRIEWSLAWAAWALGNWAFLEVVEYLRTLSVLFAIILYFSEGGDRLKLKHYQAWQVINTAQRKGGSGGRIEALQELNQDRIPLVGIDASEAYLRGVSLRRGKLSRCDFQRADIRDGDFARADLSMCSLQDANFRHSNFDGATMDAADMTGADLNGASLVGVDLSNVNLNDVDLRGSDMRGIMWERIRSIHMADIFGIRNASPELIKFALANGAVSVEADQQWNCLSAEGTGGSCPHDEDVSVPPGLAAGSQSQQLREHKLPCATRKAPQ
jgi:hypothetical protein